MVVARLGIIPLSSGRWVTVRDMVRAINSMNPGQRDLEPIGDCNTLPITPARPASMDMVTFQNSQSNFVVNDRPKVSDIFRGHVNLLAFTLEVPEFHPLLHAFRLRSKYLSRVYTQETTYEEEGFLMRN
jgi:hypothetical protein